MGPPCKIIALAMDRPTMSDIRNTILLLKETVAFLRTCNGTYSYKDGDMTFIGYIMAGLPVDIHVAKLVVLGYCFNVLRESIIIADGLTTKSIFVQEMKNVVTYYSKNLSFDPNYFVRSSDELEDRATFRTINGRDPCNTVFFSNFEETTFDRSTFRA